MGFKDLLVHVDNTKALPSRLEVALELAQSHSAHLTGVYVLPQLEMPTYLAGDVAMNLIDVQQEAVRTRTAEAETIFRNTCARAGTPAEWRTTEGGAISALSLQARYVDLIILGQWNPEDPQSIGSGLANHVVLESGRPVLIIPYSGIQKPLGKRIIIGWNASREAVRAVNDALPLLQGAVKVDVVAINSPGETKGADSLTADICLHLARHGVKTEGHDVQVGDVEVGPLLLSRATELGADLIVMGAYGHSRFRELVLGGATRHLLHHMTVPVLMSH